MHFKRSTLLASAFFCAALSSPAFSVGFSPDLGLLPELPALPAARPAALRDWTVMYFVNGKNNLEAYAMIDMNQMELAGSTDRVAITAELGRMNGQPDGDDHTEAN